MLDTRIKKEDMISLELQLFTPTTTTSTQSSDFPNHSVLAAREEMAASIAHNMKQVCLCTDTSELQARVILWVARREMEDKFKYKMGLASSIMNVQSIHGPYYGMSLKKSLRDFLQKRKHRIQSSLPYKPRMISGSACNNNASKLGDKNLPFQW